MATSVHSSHPTLSHTDDIAAAWTDTLLLAGRVLLGCSFLALGYSNLADIPLTTAYLASLGMSPAGFLAWLTGCVEIVLGAALILGIATRYAALVLFVWTLASIAIGHRYWTYPSSEELVHYYIFVKKLAAMGGALYVFVIGAGSYSIDAMLAKR
jgi:putative oxidoreductase